MSRQPLFFTYWLLHYFWFTSLFQTQSVRLHLFTYPSLCSICMTCRIPCRSIGHQVLPTQPLRKEAEDFPRGGKHSKHVPPLTYLAWLQPVLNSSRLIFKHVKTKNVLLAVKTSIKKHKVVATLISNHFNQLSIILTNFS